MLSARQSIAPLLVLGALTFGAVWPALADAAEIVKFEVDFFEDGQKEPINHATIWTSGRKIRVDQQQPGGGSSGSSLVYRGDQDIVMSVSDRTQSYVKVQRRVLTEMQGRVRAGRRSVEDHLKALPGDQRKGLETLLGVSREDPNATVNPLVVQPVKSVAERRGEVAGFACTRMVMRRGAVIIGEACVAPWERVGMTPADMEVFRSLANYQRDALGAREVTPLEIVPNQPLDLIVQFGGIPLLFERKIGAQKRSAVRVTSVDWISEEGVLFEPPAHYALVTGYAEMLSHLRPATASGEATARAADESMQETTAASVASPAAASVPAAPAPPAARATARSEGASQSLVSVPPRARVLRSNRTARRTVGATRDRKAPVRLFPNR